MKELAAQLSMSVQSKDKDKVSTTYPKENPTAMPFSQEFDAGQKIIDVLLFESVLYRLSVILLPELQGLFCPLSCNTKSNTNH